MLYVQRSHPSLLWRNLCRAPCSVLLFFSGVPTAEKPQARRVYLSGDARAWAAYRAYLDETSILIPIPPTLYRPLPKVIKRTILLDFPLYRFDEPEAPLDDATSQTGTQAETQAES
jgi:hypothetical protein